MSNCPVQAGQGGFFKTSYFRSKRVYALYPASDLTKGQASGQIPAMTITLSQQAQLEPKFQPVLENPADLICLRFVWSLILSSLVNKGREPCK